MSLPGRSASTPAAAKKSTENAIANGEKAPSAAAPVVSATTGTSIRYAVDAVRGIARQGPMER